MKITVIPFAIDQTFWDPENPGIVWVLVKSVVEVDGEYSCRLWFTVDGTWPDDRANKNRSTALFDPKQLDGGDTDAAPRTFVHGLRANRTAFGLPWMAAAQGVEQGDELKLYLEGIEMEDDPFTPAS